MSDFTCVCLYIFFPLSLSLLFSPYIVYYVSRYTGSFVCRSVGFAHFFDFRFVHSFLIHDIFFYSCPSCVCACGCDCTRTCVEFVFLFCRMYACWRLYCACGDDGRSTSMLCVISLLFSVLFFFFSLFFRRSFACCMGAACYCCGQRYQMFGSVCMGNSCGMHHVMMVLHTYIYIQYTCFIARFV